MKTYEGKAYEEADVQVGDEVVLAYGTKVIVVSFEEAKEYANWLSYGPNKFVYIRRPNGYYDGYISSTITKTEPEKEHKMNEFKICYFIDGKAIDSNLHSKQELANFMNIYKKKADEVILLKQENGTNSYKILNINNYIKEQKEKCWVSNIKYMHLSGIEFKLVFYDNKSYLVKNIFTSVEELVSFMNERKMFDTKDFYLNRKDTVNPYFREANIGSYMDLVEKNTWIPMCDSEAIFSLL